MSLKPLQTNIKIDDDNKNTKQTKKRGSLENPKSLENNVINSKIHNQKKETSNKTKQNKENLQKEEEKIEIDIFKKYGIERNEIDEELEERHNLFVEALNILMDNKDEEEKNNESEIKSIKQKLTDVIELIKEIKKENEQILNNNKILKERNDQQEVEIENLKKENLNIKQELSDFKEEFKKLKEKLNDEESEH
jgi:DNA repair exonuclease SbcCD ATPase subunit